MQRLKSSAMGTRPSLVPLLHITIFMCGKKTWNLNSIFTQFFLGLYTVPHRHCQMIWCEGHRSSQRRTHTHSSQFGISHFASHIFSEWQIYYTLLLTGSDVTSSSRTSDVCVGVACFTEELHREPRCSLQMWLWCHVTGSDFVKKCR